MNSTWVVSQAPHVQLPAHNPWGYPINAASMLNAPMAKKIALANDVRCLMEVAEEAGEEGEDDNVGWRRTAQPTKLRE